MPAEQVTVATLLEQGERLGIRCVAGTPASRPVTGVEILALEHLAQATPGRLVIVGTPDGGTPARYQIDVALRRVVAAGCAGVVLVGGISLAATARALAERGGITVLESATEPSELALALDRAIRGGAQETLSRAEEAISRATAVAREVPARESRDLLDEAGAALGVHLRLVEDAAVSWTEPEAVCVGEVPVGRLVTDRQDGYAAGAESSVALALPVIASLLSRAMQRELQARFGPVRSRADLIVELVFADSARIDTLAVEAARAGLPVALSHVVGWLVPTHVGDPERRPPAVIGSSLELRAQQLVDRRPEEWHLAVIHESLVAVSSEPVGTPDQQRRLRAVMEELAAHAAAFAGGEWAFTIGLGTPQAGAAGLRQSATEARIAAETAVVDGRVGSVQVTDVTGLRRVLLDFHASPLSRSLLDDVLAPVDALGPERADTAVHTLLAYLRHRNSLSRAAEELNLHPNAVNYRVRRIEETLGLDLRDPDVGFALELACRIRLLTPAGGR